MNIRQIQTPRLRTAVRTAGTEGGTPVILIHGNVSSGLFFEETLAALPGHYWLIAPDLRGFGDSEHKPVDATRGLGDFVDDLRALVAALDIEEPVHLLGWSMGGGVAMQYAMEHPAEVASLSLMAPLSPHGFGGTRGPDGVLVWPDGAGSGGGAVNPDFVQRLSDGDEGETSPFSPRSVMNQFYFKPGFRLEEERETDHVRAMNKTRIDAENYPGDSIESANWPHVAPGNRGVNNAMAPTHFNVSGLVDIDPKPPILWMRGDSDQIVSDTSFFDLGYLGQIGAVPGWPGAEAVPPQPMITQTRRLLERYAASGGRFEEEVIADAGHSPHIEKPEEFLEVFGSFLRRNS